MLSFQEKLSLNSYQIDRQQATGNWEWGMGIWDLGSKVQGSEVLGSKVQGSGFSPAAGLRSEPPQRAAGLIEKGTR